MNLIGITANFLAGKLEEAAKDLKSGKCSLDDEEITGITKAILHRKLNIEQVCNEYGFSRATLNRKIKDGLIPKPHKDPGGKEYFWQDEIETKLEENLKK